MPTYKKVNGGEVYVNPLHVVTAEPNTDQTGAVLLNETRILFPITAVSISQSGAGAGLAFCIVAEPTTNVIADMKAWEKGMRRGGLEVVR